MAARDPSVLIDEFVHENAGLGLDPGAVSVQPSDRSWSAAFHQLREGLRLAVPGAEIEHVGSTSVPGLAAKPLLDVAIGFGPTWTSETLIGALGAAGVSFESDLGDFGGLFFTVRDGRGRTMAHLHVVSTSDPQWRRYLAFRDHLRSNPEIAEEYAELKRRLATDFAEDRAGYTAAKFDWVLRQVIDLEPDETRRCRGAE